MIYLDSRDYIKLRGKITTLKEDLKKIVAGSAKVRPKYHWEYI
jgi:hypothetical protein